LHAYTQWQSCQKVTKNIILSIVQKKSHWHTSKLIVIGMPIVNDLYGSHASGAIGILEKNLLVPMG
jgi:hypothetical protein